MKNKKLQKLVAGLLLVASTCSIAAPITAYAQSPENEAVATQNNENYRYLSEMSYIPRQSYVGYGRIIMDGSASGSGIQLIVDEETVSFDRGIGAHAQSCLVYDISQYSNVYSRFISYVGVDARQGGNGDGVIFTISVSDDGTNWQDLKKTGVLKGNNESVFVDVNVTGKKFLRLFAHKNGGNGSDHSVYADARLIKPDYNPNVEDNVPFKTLADYDKELSARSIEENLKDHIHTIYEREFVRQVGYQTLKKLYQDQDTKEAIEYLRTDKKALAYFIEGGPLNKLPGNSTYRGMRAFCDIYNKHKDKLKSGEENDFYLRLAISIASTFVYPNNVSFWITPNKGSDGLKRFETYITLSEPGGVMDRAGSGDGISKWSAAQFRQLSVPMMRWVVDARMNDDEFLWLADYALKQREIGNKFLDAYNYIKYRIGYQYDDQKYYSPENHAKWNEKYNFDGYFNDYGANIKRLWIVFAEGSVCGGLAKTYANLAEVFGRPSIVVGQPGHAATVTWEYDPRSQKHIWKIQNDISGWTKSNSEHNDFMLGWGTSKYAASQGFRATYTLLASDASEDRENFVKANQCVLLANSYTDQSTKETLYRKALDHQKINLSAWDGLVSVKLANENLTSQDYLTFSEEIMGGLTYYPKPMDDLLKAIRPKITNVQNLAEFELIRQNALKQALQATTENIRQPNVPQIVARELLNQNTSQLASFSFDGEKAGTIVLNSMYDQSSVRVKYSIDGGQKWTQTDAHEIVLSQDQLNQLNGTNDILVGLVGVKNTYTIDLVDSKRPTENGIYLNDFENLFIGSTKNLEFSLDNGTTWCKYMPGLESNTRFPGDQQILLRYMSHGRTIQSQPDAFTFTENGDTPEKTYLPLKHVTLVSYSSQQNNGGMAARNLIDGNPNTHWHTSYGKVDAKEYVVEFDTPRHISALEYLPHSPNGRWKDVEIYTSMDKAEWKKVGTASLPNSDGWKNIPLNAEYEAKFLKVKGLTSWGNSTGEQNKYFSGRMLNFYEDLTKNRLPLATVSYSTETPTNQDVVASIQLPEGCEMIEGEAAHTFAENGTHLFRYKDRHDNVYEVMAEVTWIRKTQLTGTITYSETAPTRNQVVATVGGFQFDDVYVSNNDGALTHTFTENGTFVFELTDSYGNTGSVTATVNNIDQTAPKLHVEYSTTEWTSDDVTAVVKADNENETFFVTNNEGNPEYVFQKNGTFTFEVQDEAGNTAQVTATVDCIDKSKDQIQPDFSATEETHDPVTVSLAIDPASHEIINNGGSGSYTFTENGTFVFKIRLLDSGKVVDYPITVSNIVEKPAPQPEQEIPPVTEPEVPPVTEPETPPVTEPEVPPVTEPETPPATEPEKPWVPEPEYPSEPPAPEPPAEPPFVPPAAPPNLKPQAPASGSKPQATAQKPNTATTDKKDEKDTDTPKEEVLMQKPEETTPNATQPETSPAETQAHSNPTAPQEEVPDAVNSIGIALIILVATVAVVGIAGGAILLYKRK